MNKFFIGLGMFIILGVAGSCDLGTITLTETLIYISISLFIIFIGLVGYNKEIKQK